MNIKALDYYHGGLAKKILERDNYQCVKCGSKEDLNIDHIQPVRLGGKSTMENQRTLCRSCHSIHTNTKNKNTLSYQGKYQREWKTKNPEYFLNYFREWRKKHPKYYTKYAKGTSELYRKANVI